MAAANLLLIQSVVTVAALIIILALHVAYLMWVYGITRNLESFLNYTDVSPGWAVGYYFIPIFSLYKPYQNMSDVWEKSESNVQPTNAMLIGWWWAFYVTANIISTSTVIRAALNHTRVELPTQIVAKVLSLIALVLMIMLVRAVNDRQEAKERQMIAG